MIRVNRGASRLAAILFGLGATAAAAGTLTPIAPFDEAGVAYTGVAVYTGLLGINDAGYTTGSIGLSDGSVLGFLRSPAGVYTTFSTPGSIDTYGRAIGADNSVVGYSYGYDAAAQGQREFVRAPGGAITILTNPVTGSPLNAIAQGINASGAIVGNYYSTTAPYQHEGFILSGSSFTELPGMAAARGITNSGTVVGWTSSQGAVYQSGSYSYYTAPGDTGNGTFFEAVNNHGIATGSYYDSDYNEHSFTFDIATHSFTNIVVPGATEVESWGINDSGQYVVDSDAGQFIYTPGGASAPNGASVFMPVSGLNLPTGSNEFAITVTPDTTYYVDPALATGFEYLAGNGPLFASVTAPTGIGIANAFQLWLWNGSRYVYDTTVTGGVAFDFTTPVSRFELRGIPASAGIDPAHSQNFVTGLTFASAGNFDGFQNALTAVPEPASWALLIAGFGATGAAIRRRRVAAAS